MTSLTYSEATLRVAASADVFHRGEQYLARGQVIRLVQRGDLLLGTVEGSDAEPYRVRITLEDGEPSDVDCTCPYDYGGWCKHIVAVLLAAIRRPDMIVVRTPLMNTITRMGVGQLRTLLLLLSEQNPAVADMIDEAIDVIEQRNQGTTGTTVPFRRTPADPQPMRKRIRRLFQNIEEAGANPTAPVHELTTYINELVALVRRMTRTSDARDGLQLLDHLIEEVCTHWESVVELEHPPVRILIDLGRVLTEGLLSADLSAAERKRWVQRIEAFQDELVDSHDDRVFNMPRAAAMQGWTYPPLVEVLKGNITTKGAWQGAIPSFADDLANIRLDILERRGEIDKFIHLAEAEGQLDRMIVMMAQKRSPEEVAAKAISILDNPQELQSVAQVLLERGATPQAMKVAQAGLKQSGQTAPLAIWTAAFAEQIGSTDDALRAARKAFDQTPSYDLYLQLRRLSGVGWPELREELLRQLRTAELPLRERVRIYLEEGMVEPAMRIAADETDEGLLLMMLEGIRGKRPDRAILLAEHAAERLIKAGGPANYEAAINWLRRAREIAPTGLAKLEWDRYVTRLRKIHWRKERLVHMLTNLQQETTGASS